VQDYGGTVMKTTLSEEHVMKLRSPAAAPAPTGGTSLARADR
jgi:hypothetical protein